MAHTEAPADSNRNRIALTMLIIALVAAMIGTRGQSIAEVLRSLSF